MLYGGDAFYLTVGNLSLRSDQGFTWDTLSQAVQLAQQQDKRIYFCLNLFAYEQHLTAIAETLEKLNNYALDGIIIADPGVLAMAKKYLPNTAIHLSTQANTSNSETVKFWQQQGVSRINLARELNYKNIRTIREQCSDIELEVFVHGAMCMALSGRCLMSSYLNQRSANLGKCAHPCRFNYRESELLLEEQTRAGQPIWELQEDNDFSKILTVDDLCLVKYLKWFMAVGIDSIKIEGRTKSAGYIARVADVYKTALTDAKNDNNQYSSYLEEILQAGSRPLSTGLFFGAPKPIALSNVAQQPIFAQLVEPVTHNKWLIQIKSIWQQGTTMRLMLPGLQRPIIEAKDYAIENHTGELLTVAHPGTQAYLRLEHPALLSGMFLIQNSIQLP